MAIESAIDMFDYGFDPRDIGMVLNHCIVQDAFAALTDEDEEWAEWARDCGKHHVLPLSVMERVVDRAPHTKWSHEKVRDYIITSRKGTPEAAERSAIQFLLARMLPNDKIITPKENHQDVVSSRPSSHLEALPVELRAKILESLPSLTDVRHTVSSSRCFRDLWPGSSTKIATRLLPDTAWCEDVEMAYNIPDRVEWSSDPQTEESSLSPMAQQTRKVLALTVSLTDWSDIYGQ